MNNPNHETQCEIGKSMSEGKSYEEAMAAFVERERELLDRDGWVAHLVHGDPSTATGVNYHTHGLSANFQHPDFQLVVALPQQTTSSIFRELIDRVKAGERFQHGDIVSKIVKNYDVKLISAIENERGVLRIILPDAQGKLEQEEMADNFGLQYE